MTMTAAMIYPALLAFMRALGLLLLLPVFSGATVPVMVRIAIAAMLGGIAAPFVGTPEFPAHWLMLLLATAHEFVAGLLMGLAARMLFYALEMAGQIASTEMGLMMSSSVDPITRTAGSPASSLLFYFGTILFLVTGAHQFCLAAFVRSFEVFPTDAAFDPATADFVVARSAGLFLVAVQMTAPLLAVNFLVNLAFAVLGRAAPAIDVFGSSFAVRILAGLAVFGLTLALTAQYASIGLRDLPENMLRFLR